MTNVNSEQRRDAEGSDGAAPGPSRSPSAAPSERAAEAASGGWATALKEMTTTVLALAVGSVALSMLSCTYVRAGAVGFPEQKDVMLHGLSLLGAVIGYYFGRVPAERRAEKAEAAVAGEQEKNEKQVEMALDAENRAADAETRLRAAKTLVERELDAARDSDLDERRERRRRVRRSRSLDPTAGGPAGGTADDAIDEGSGDGGEVARLRRVRDVLAGL